MKVLLVTPGWPQSSLWGQLAAMGKKSNLKTSFTEAIKKFHDHGIGVLASFVLGYDYDTPDTF